MQNNDLVTAKKGDQTTTFSSMAWKAMGKNKNGWELVDPEASETVKADVDTEKAYKALIKDANKAEKDGDYALAIEKLTEAQEIKPTPLSEQKIAELSTKTEADAKYADMVKSGDEAFGKEDWATAFEMYAEALAIKEDKNVRANYNKAQKALEGK